MGKTKKIIDIDYRSLFEGLPGLYLILQPNAPSYTIIEASDEYLKATMTRRVEIVGKNLFDVFPDNPDDIAADGSSNLQQSLRQVITTRKKHVMAIQKYDIQRPLADGGGFEVRYWNPVNTPLITNNQLTYIIHQVQDVTELVRSNEKGLREAEIAKEKLEEKIQIVNDNDARISQILNVLLKYTMLDFSDQITTTDKGDELDAIAVGLNTLSEELKSYIEQIQENQEKINQTNDFLNTILENIPNMIFVKDAKELRFVRFNKAGEELLGYKKEELLGKNDYDFFPKEQADFFVQNDQETIMNRVLLDIEEEKIKTLSGDKWLHTKKIPILDANGEPTYLLGISEDISERKKNQEQLETINKELESFSYSISHDLRAPLRAIHGYTKILEEDYYEKLDEEGKKTIGAVLRNSKRMGELIDDLLSFSRLGKKELSTSLTDMNMLVKDVCSEIIPSELRSKINVNVKTLSPAYADHALIRQVWTNLISNAAKFTAKNDLIQIEIGSKQNGVMNEYYVKDNGVGFDMRYADKLFGVFQRLHSQEDFEGTGVGLAIVNRIIVKHHGSVWVNSKLNIGTTFYFTLPLTNETITTKT